MRFIDLNCDMGELPAAIADGTQEALMRSISSANVACGGHAGDRQTMTETLQQAIRWNVSVGAHPGYDDPANFGRRELDLSSGEVSESVYGQVAALSKIADACGVRIVHVKPHGALYNQAVNNRHLAAAIASGVARWSTNVVLVGLAGSPMLEVFREAGFRVVGEGFADRRYEADGTLRSRRFEDALIRDPREAAQQALSIMDKGKVTAWDGSEVQLDAQTICIHGDTPGAMEIASRVAETLRQAGGCLKGLDQFGK